MKLELSGEKLFHTGFAIIFLKQPLQYLVGSAYLIVLAMGMGFCLASLLINFKFLNLAKKDSLLTALFLGIFLLHVLLALIGTTPQRLLWFSGLSQLLLLVPFLHYRHSPDTWKFIKLILITLLIIECTLAFLQVSYYSTGIGLPPIFDEYEKYSFVSGSFFNANDFSVFVVSCYMALYSIWITEKKEYLGLLLAGLVIAAVFVSLSRTAFVFMLLLFIFILQKNCLRVLLAPNIKSNLITLIIIVLTFFSAIYMLQSDFLSSTTVFERSMTRITTVTGVTNDESASTRSLVYLRLYQNIPNLGFGTFSDLNYARFFESQDFSLMKVNPHSFVAELSFLYGWFGFIIGLGLILLLITKILKNYEIPTYVRLTAAVSLIFFQSVPSSILFNINFFIPYILIAYCKNFHQTKYQKYTKTSPIN